MDAAAGPDERHLVVHEGHVTHVTARDRPLLGVMPVPRRFVGPPDDVAASLKKLAGSRADEFIYTPAGPDMARELRMFREVMPVEEEQ